MTPHEQQTNGQQAADQSAGDRALLAEHQRLAAIPDDEKTEAGWQALEQVADAMAQRALQAWDAEAQTNPELNTEDWLTEAGTQRGWR